MNRVHRSDTMWCVSHTFAQRFLNSKRPQSTRHEDEMLWHKMERAVQCADAGIDGQDKMDTNHQNHLYKSTGRLNPHLLRVTTDLCFLRGQLKHGRLERGHPCHPVIRVFIVNQRCESRRSQKYSWPTFSLQILHRCPRLTPCCYHLF